MIFTSINPTTGKRELRRHIPYRLDETTMQAFDARNGRLLARFHHGDVAAAKRHLDSITESVK